MPPKKKLVRTFTLQLPAGQATPAPPVGPALGQHGVNIMEFVKAFNAQTQSDAGTVIPVVITVYEDRSFTFVTKSPPAAVLIKQALSLEKGASEPYREQVGTITQDQLRQIAERKMKDLNANDVEAAERPRTRAQFSIGESVKVVSGPLSDFSGEISEVMDDASKLRVLVSIFGRETPVEVGFDQVKKI